MGSAVLPPHLSFLWDPFSSKELGSKMEKDSKYQTSVLPCLSFFLSSRSIYLWGLLSSSQLNAESLLGHVCEFSRGNVGGGGGFPVHYVFFWEISLTWSLLTPPPQMLLEPDPFPAQILDPTASVAAVSSLYGLSSWTPNSSIKVSYPHINLNHGNLPLHCCCNKIWIWISLSPFSLSLSHTHTQSLSLSFQLKYPQWALTSKSVHVSEKFLWIHHLLLGLGWGGQGCVCGGVSTLYNGKDDRLITHSFSAHRLEYSASWELDWR